MSIKEDVVKDESSKDSLVASAIKLFSTKGYNGVSVKEISADAKVNVALISYYFGGKEALLHSALEALSRTESGGIESILMLPTSKKETRVRLKLFLRHLAKFYLAHTDLLKLYLHELENGSVGAVQTFNRSYGHVVDQYLNFLKIALDKKFLQGSDDVRLTSLQILSPFASLIKSGETAKRFYGISLQDTQFRTRLIRQVVESVMAA